MSLNQNTRALREAVKITEGVHQGVGGTIHVQRGDRKWHLRGFVRRSLNAESRRVDMMTPDEDAVRAYILLAEKGVEGLSEFGLLHAVSLKTATEIMRELRTAHQEHGVETVLYHGQIVGHIWRDEVDGVPKWHVLDVGGEDVALAITRDQALQFIAVIAESVL